MDPYIGEKLAAAANNRLVGHRPLWTWVAHPASALIDAASTLTVLLKQTRRRAAGSERWKRLPLLR
jgi:hypothetical protein